MTADLQNKIKKHKEAIRNTYERGKSKGYKEGQMSVISSAEVLKGTASGEVVAVNDVSPIEPKLKVNLTSATITDFSTVSVSKYGKNLMSVQPKRELSASLFKNCYYLPKGTYTVSMKIAGATNWRFCYILFDINGKQVKKTGAPNELPIQSLSGQAIAFYPGNSGGQYQWGGNGNQTKQTFVIDDNYYVGMSVYFGDTSANTVISEAQIELGSVATEYEPYIEPETVLANADGTVEGLLSLSPNMTLITDTGGVVIDLEYYKDIDLAFENLTTAIALSGGE